MGNVGKTTIIIINHPQVITILMGAMVTIKIWVFPLMNKPIRGPQVVLLGLAMYGTWTRVI
jgi:hypothetical protein